MDNQENNRLTKDNMGKFVMIPHTFIQDAKDKKLSFHARWLFVALRYYTNGRSGTAFPSYPTIIKLTGMRREKISDSIKELEIAGWLIKRPRFGNSSIYTLTVPRTAESPSPSEISEESGSRGAVRAITFGDFDPKDAVKWVKVEDDDPNDFEELIPFLDYMATQAPT